MSRRILALGAAGIALVGLWVGAMFLLPHDRGYLPKFLAGAQDAPQQPGHLNNAPFVKKLGPNWTQNLGTGGVSCHDYLLPGTFDSVYKAASNEFGKGTSWESFYTSPENPPIGKMTPVTAMDALFTRKNDAVSIYRVPVDGKVRVRVWHRSPSLFGS